VIRDIEAHAVDDRTQGRFTIYDGDRDAYIADFLKYFGPLFDQLAGRFVELCALAGSGGDDGNHRVPL
jgi:hypothetical protein